MKNIIVITSKFHMERSKVIFNYFNKILSTNINIEYIETFDKLDEEILKHRNNREKNSCLNFKKNIIDKLNNIQEFTGWFYTEHNAYKSIITYKNNKTINKSY